MFLQPVFCHHTHKLQLFFVEGVGYCPVDPVFVGRALLREWCFCVVKYSVPIFFTGVTLCQWWPKLERLVSSLLKMCIISLSWGQYQLFFITLMLSSFVLIDAFEGKCVEDNENNGNTDGRLGWHSRCGGGGEVSLWAPSSPCLHCNCMWHEFYTHATQLVIFHNFL